MCWSRWIEGFFLILIILGFFQVSLAEPFLEEIEDKTLEQIENQQKGEYAELSRSESLPLGQIQEVWDEASPNAGVYKASYDPNHIIRIKTRPFVTTTIVLPEWEEVKDISIGDDEFFLTDKKGDNIVSLMSKSEGCDTSLTIIGKKGDVYAFYIRSEGIHSIHIPDIVVYVKSNLSRHKRIDINFLPKDLEKPLTKKDPSDPSPDYMETLPFSPESITFSFEMTAQDIESQSIAPEFVYSDGIWTWLDYRERWNKVMLPAVYQVIDGVDTPVNTRVVGTKIIVHGAGSLTLKSGQRIVCITPLKE